MRRALGVAAILLCAAVPVTAQSVQGRILDATSGQPVSEVRVTLQRSNGSGVTDAISDPQGRFHIIAPGPGDYRLATSHIAYRGVTTEVFVIGSEEQVVVDLQVTMSAVTLQPLIIVARRVDPRHQATEDGFYARRLRTPPIGNARVLLPHDPEMQNAGIVRDVLIWTRGPRSCTVMYWNGKVVNDSALAAEMWNTPVDALEGVEYYRNPADAPFVFQDKPVWANWTDRGGGALCSVVALWPRTGRYLAEYVPPVPVRLFPWRVAAAGTVYHITGDRYAPGAGAGLELNSYWPVTERLYLGLFLRGSAHTLDAAAADSLSGTLSSLQYRLPPGRLPTQLLTLGIEPRFTILTADAFRAAVGVRLLGAVRRFALQKNAVGVHRDNFNSTGWGGGMTGAVEWRLNDRLDLRAGAGYDLLSFGSYPQTERTGGTTSGTWRGTSLQLGVVFNNH